MPVLDVDSLVLRPIPAGGAPVARLLHRLAWAPVEPGEPVETRLARCPAGLSRPNAIAWALRTVHEHLATPAGLLTIVLRGAVVAPYDPVPAAVWGLLSSAQTENPGRFVLVDIDPRDPGAAPVVKAAAATGQPQVAVRDGQYLAPRLERATPGDAAVGFGDGTVLLTGAGGALGTLLARHLVSVHGVRDLLLVSRSGADDLATELGVRSARCDLADRDAVAALLQDERVTAVVHAAGITDDGLVTGLTPERVERVLAAKSEAALHLHELTAGKPLAAFVIFSSIAGVLGAAGQGAYAAANRALDALMQQRVSAGRPGLSLAWGLWDTGLAGGLAEADRARLQRDGIVPLTPEQGLALFDLALATGGDGLLVPAGFDPARLGERLAADPGAVPAMLRPLARIVATRPETVTGGWAKRLTGLGPGERRRVLLDLLRSEAATVLGRGGAATVRPQASFTELGFDSLMGGRPAQPGRRRDRAPARRHPGLRLPDPGRAGRRTAGPALPGPGGRRPGRGPGAPGAGRDPAGHVAGGRAAGRPAGPGRRRPGRSSSRGTGRRRLRRDGRGRARPRRPRSGLARLRRPDRRGGIEMAASNEQVVQALRASLKENERLKQENQQLVSKSTEPVAIVGMACRYPGGVRLARGPLGPGRPGPRRDRRVPGRPRLGPRAPVRPRPGRCTARSYCRDGGFLARRGRLRRRLLRHLPARGPGDGPAAAAAAGDGLGGVRARPGSGRTPCAAAGPGSSPG